MATSEDAASLAGDAMGPPIALSTDARTPDGGPDSALPTDDAGAGAIDGQTAEARAPAGEDAGAAPADAESLPAASLRGVTCASAAPPGATLAAPLPTYSGTSCPALSVGSSNRIVSGGVTRHFVLLTPTDSGAAEKLPVLFLWHWLQGSAEELIDRIALQRAVDTGRFIAVVPEKRGDLDFSVDLGWFGELDVGIPWPIVKLPRARLEQELLFFDDMLACVGAQFPVNKECVGTAGISAGALFSAQLAAARSAHLSALISVSGGVESSGLSNRLLMDWPGAEHRLPALIMWGGEEDQCLGLDFEEASRQLEDELQKDGHLVVECVHNCKHGEWFDADADPRFDHLLQFFLAHPFWLEPGQSPYAEAGLPETFPKWCGVGPGSAVERRGSCPDPSCPLPF